MDLIHAILEGRMPSQVALLRKGALVHTELLLIVIHTFLVGLQALMRVLIEMKRVLIG
jgi:hypothetical protein